ncbi:hypothetical protein OCH239_03920 [Roseivivax halodurans JCM 10272]|uniref:Uncharacterized protein n=1 Tax=Roseivivax halodurans JCM 10272 TaxID=1449350 RepID=X7EEB6_9RHOB|nr:hypothetical protein [Roseivivax halodurans]ETX14225.1 hypothetical protein OCH239_03920 [Roseivivax halodurans JCM 10272]
MTPRAFAATALVLGLAGHVSAADFSDPTWPCQQAKVEGLSPGLMWPQPLPETEPAMDEATRADIRSLVGQLTLRRLDLPEVEPALDTFAAEHGRDPALMGHVFQEVFDIMSRTRAEIMTGIEEYSLSQIDLAERIDAARNVMEAEMAKEEPDFDKVDAAEEQLAWDERIYDERRQSLTYVCETPVLLEKRLYAIAQMLLKRVES